MNKGLSGGRSLPKRKTETRPKVVGVASADRLLTVLSAFKRGDDALTLAELAERTNLIKSTILRLCVSLERFGFVERIADGRYRLGMEMIRLGSVCLQSFALEEHIVPALNTLVTASGETASFYIRRGEQRLCLFRVPSPSRLKIDVRPGDMRPMDLASTAQVLRLFGSLVVQEARRIEAPIYTSGTTDPHIASMSMPVFGAGGRLLGAMSVSGPASRFTRERAAGFRETLRETAESVTSALDIHPLDVAP